MQPATRSSRQPLGGSSGDWHRRLLRFHLPLVLASAVVLLLFMTLPPFDPQAYPQVDMSGGVIPQQVEPMDHGEGQTGSKENDGQQHGGQLSRLLNYFVVDGSLLTNTFGLGNWAGLAALVIVVGLLALSNDFALRKLKARSWKNLQRLNYALFALVIVHAFFYGALLRMTSPFTLLLGLSVIAVFAGQAVGVWLWRRRHTRPPAGPL